MPYWRLFLDAKISIEVLDSLGMVEILKLNDLLNMREDYKIAELGKEEFSRPKR